MKGKPMTKENPDFIAKRIGVVGAGPVGCIVAAFLSKGGHEVAICDVIPEMVDPAGTTGIYI
jgi:2-dehydropantoate 2-reductase